MPVASQLRSVSVLDTHTAGEPTRVILAGAPELAGSSMAEKRESLWRDHRDFCRSVLAEPRGFEAMVAALLVPAQDSSAVTGVIFFNNVGPLNMCGHGTIGVLVALGHLGRISPGRHQLETPVGMITAELHDDHTVSIENVPSYRDRKAIEIDVTPFGMVTGDIAWGGNWFFLTDDCPLPLEASRIPQLTAYANAIRRALEERGLRGANESEIDHIEICGRASDEGCHSRNFVLCPGGEYDRSPCGTGTSARLACLVEDGKVSIGKRITQQGILGTRFEAEALPNANLSAGIQDPGIIPRITGKAWVTAETKLLFDPGDPFQNGIPSTNDLGSSR